jgi:hypothetical protein
MRRSFLCFFLALFLLIAGCVGPYTSSTDSDTPTQTDTLYTEAQTTEPAATEPVTTDASASETEPETTTEAALSVTEIPVTASLIEPTEPSVAPELSSDNSAFFKMVGPCDGSILAAVYNAPYAIGTPMPTSVWSEGEYDRLVIYPRWVGSEVSAWKLIRGENGEVIRREGPVYSAVCYNGDCYAASLERPEGGASWMLMVRTPDGSEASMELEYNGRYGTPAFEFLADPHASSLDVSVPDIDNPEWLESILGANPLYGLLRAADRAGIDPWKAIYDYCSPLSAWDDSAAYTIYHGDMYEGTYFLELGRVHESYDSGSGNISERLSAQYDNYQENGNTWGILAPGHEDGEALYVDLKGITIYNPTLLAKSVSVTVNGTFMGAYELTEGDFCTLLDLNVTRMSAYQPVQVEVHVTESLCDRDDVILEVWGSLGGNISGAR